MVLARADLAQSDYASGEGRLHDLISDPRTPAAQRESAKSLLAEFQVAKGRKFDA